MRFYERSRLFFDVLSGHDDEVDTAIDASAPDWTHAEDAPPDDFLDRPADLLATAPPCPRFPLLSEHDLDDDDEGEDEPPADPRFFDPKRFFRKHKLNERISESWRPRRRGASASVGGAGAWLLLRRLRRVAEAGGFRFPAAACQPLFYFETGRDYVRGNSRVARCAVLLGKRSRVGGVPAGSTSAAVVICRCPRLVRRIAILSTAARARCSCLLDGALGAASCQPVP